MFGFDIISVDNNDHVQFDTPLIAGILGQEAFLRRKITFFEHCSANLRGKGGPKEWLEESSMLVFESGYCISVSTNLTSRNFYRFIVTEQSSAPAIGPYFLFSSAYACLWVSSIRSLS